jgi:hypothetical protein
VNQLSPNALFLAMLAFATGCINVTEENFVDLVADYACQAAEKCTLAQFEASFDDHEDCQSGVYGTFETVEDLADLANCTWDKETAEFCISEMRAADCEAYGSGELFANCAEAWSDCNLGW